MRLKSKVENARLYEQAEQSAVAAERTRLARDLHDAVTSGVTTYHIYLALITHGSGASEAASY